MLIHHPKLKRLWLKAKKNKNDGFERLDNRTKEAKEFKDEIMRLAIKEVDLKKPQALGSPEDK